MDINEKLIKSIKSEDLESVKEYLKNGADANARDDKTNSALSCAIAFKPNFKIIKLLVEHGADVNAKTRLVGNDEVFEYPIVQMAREFAYKNSKEEDEKIMKYLIANGANVNLCDSGGTTALQWICTLDKDKNPLEMAKYLIEQGANVNPRHSHPTTLSWAIGKTDYDINLIKYLIEHGTDVNAKDKNGETPLMCAAHKHNFEIAKLLIDNGADVNAKDDKGYTALIYNARPTITLSKDYIDYVDSAQTTKLLIDNGANVNAKTDFGKTALHLSFFYKSLNKIQNIKILIDNGIDVNAKDNDGKTALDYLNEAKESVVKESKPNDYTTQITDFKEIKTLLKSKMQIAPKAKTKSKSNDFEMGM